MVSDNAIVVSDLSKRYQIGHRSTERYVAMRDVIAHGTRKTLGIIGGLFSGRTSPSEDIAEDFWALDNINFQVRRGDTVGIIGRNGAGKSTLLKILSRITEPTTGRVEINGRVASLLEVGTGFHPELTGRENIFLNGAILGMSRAEIRKRFDEIVAFAEVEKFLETPVKRYSSGMYVRLAFAVAAHIEPEILIVDEVLAVGDIAFQRKCIGKLNDVAAGGRTVLFVSHNTGLIETLTKSAIYLRNGKLELCGPTAEVVAKYTASARQATTDDWEDVSNQKRVWRGDGGARIEKVRVSAEQISDVRVVLLEAQGSTDDSVADLRLSFTIFRADGMPVGSGFGSEVDLGGASHFHLKLSLPPTSFAPGTYYVAIGVGQGDYRHGWRDFDVVSNCCFFEVPPPLNQDGTTGAWTSNWGPIVFHPNTLVAPGLAP